MSKTTVAKFGLNPKFTALNAVIANLFQAYECETGSIEDLVFAFLAEAEIEVVVALGRELRRTDMASLARTLIETLDEVVEFSKSG